MIPEFGYYALLMAWLLAILMALVPRWVPVPIQTLMWLPIHRMTVGLIIVSYGCLTWCFLVNDFSVSYVARLSSTILPYYYRITAVWGGHEGSMLLWVMFLAGWIFSLTFIRDKISQACLMQVSVIAYGVLACLLGFIILSSDPFERLLPMPMHEGQELNPLLQDIGFIVHPPILYLGYVGLTLVCALFLGAWATGMNRATARLFQPFVMAAWGFLTLGITLGSWWAYRELGWGGWWFWDKVENASLLPWLVATMLLHTLAIYIKQDKLARWVVGLAVCAFLLSILATFLVRSGILTSVHAFVTEPTRGLYILGFLVGSTLYAVKLFNQGLKYSVTIQTGRRNIVELFIILNNLLLGILLLCIILGTFYPLGLDVFYHEQISVGPAYFNTILKPIVVPLLLLVGGAHWILKPRGWDSYKCSLIVAILSGLLAFGCLSSGFSTVYPMAWAGLGLGFWIILSSWLQLYRWYTTGHKTMFWHKLSMVLAHTGIGLMAIGITLVSYYAIERTVKLHMTDRVELDHVILQYQADATYERDNYLAQVVYLQRLDQASQPVFSTEKRFYRVSRRVMTDVGILSTLWGDIYVALGEQWDKHTWSMRIYTKPGIRLIWLGGLWMFIGAIIAVWRSRWRRCNQ